MMGELAKRCRREGRQEGKYQALAEVADNLLKKGSTLQEIKEILNVSEEWLRDYKKWLKPDAPSQPATS
ncbi:MAG: hypothetical protein LBR11_02835 [Deltaproteobacteria bacterium]|jgi:predicted transposase YdaD|nr:hypothetical protein [Deltaproteobacteria bacterium]